MHESPAVNIEEMMWRWEREARATGTDKIEQMVATWQPHRWAASTQSFRQGLATFLIALATRLAPTIAVPNPHPPALVR